MKYDALTICSLNAEQKSRTCGYWYTVQNHCTAHTAFETREAAVAWLKSLKLTIDGELPPEGTHGYFQVKGEYRRELVMCSEEHFDSLPGLPVAVLENGGYRPGKLTEDCDGVRVLTVSNVNNKWAKEYDYKTCRTLKKSGITVF